MTYRTWAKAALIRMVRTGAAAALGVIGSTAKMLGEVDWGVVWSGTALTVVITGLLALTGLPEASTNGPLEGGGGGE